MSWQPMDTCRVIQLIECTATRRGEGVVGDPIRIIREYFTFDGQKVAEVDPEFQSDDGRVRFEGVKQND